MTAIDFYHYHGCDHHHQNHQNHQKSKQIATKKIISKIKKIKKMKQAKDNQKIDTARHNFNFNQSGHY